MSESGQIPYNCSSTEEEILFDAIPKMKIPDCLKKVIQLKLRQSQHKEDNNYELKKESHSLNNI